GVAAFERAEEDLVERPLERLRLELLRGHLDAHRDLVALFHGGFAHRGPGVAARGLQAQVRVAARVEGFFHRSGNGAAALARGWWRDGWVAGRKCGGGAGERRRDRARRRRSGRSSGGLRGGGGRCCDLALLPAAEERDQCNEEKEGSFHDDTMSHDPAEGKRTRSRQNVFVVTFPPR